MKVIDLTHKIHNQMIHFDAPWHTETNIRRLGSVADVGRNTSVIDIGSHAGTHIDASLHFMENGQAIDQVPLEKLVGPVAIVDFSHLPEGACVTPQQLSSVALGERTIFRFGWSRHWGDQHRFYSNWPYFSTQAAQYLVDHGVKVVGLDTPSPDDSRTPLLSKEDSVIHKLLLSSGVTLIEYLANLDDVDAVREWILCALPLSLEGCDGSPARVCLMTMNEGCD